LSYEFSNTVLYYTINPKTLLLIKKKRYIVRPRARAKKQEYSFTILLFPPLPLP
jgi:hypothetical protein